MKSELGYLVSIGILIVAIALVSWLFFFKHNTVQVNAAKGCVASVYSLGSSGHCVSDIQTLVDEMETTGYSECPFDGASALNINGEYNSSTKNQVETVQKWINCYNNQEGTQSTISLNGEVGNSTWAGLCNYGYLYPKRSNNHTSSYYQRALSAGIDANCSSL